MFSYSYVLLLINGMQLDLFLGTWPNFKINKITNFVEIFSIFLLLTVFAFTLIFNYFVMKALFEYFQPQQNPDVPNKITETYKSKNFWLSEIFDSFNMTKTSSSWFILLSTLRDIFLPLTLIYGIENPYLQLIPNFLIFFLQ